jgi:hypothetical protein
MKADKVISKGKAAAKAATEKATIDPNDTWVSLSYFQVKHADFSNDNPLLQVYRNDRQQVRVSVLFEARDANNEVVALTFEQQRQITLVNYNTGAPLPSGFSIQRWRNYLYDYYDSSSFLAKAADSGVSLPDPIECRGIMQETERSEPYAMQEIGLWITATSQETIRIAAELPSPAGTTFHTHSSDVPAGGVPVGGKFNSSVSVRPITPHRFSSKEFSTFRHDPSSTDSFDVDMYDVFITDTDYKIRASRHYVVEGDTAHYSYEKKNRWNYVQIAFTANRSREYIFKCFHPSSSAWIKIDVNKDLEEKGFASVVRVIDKGGKGFSKWTDRSAEVGYIDNFGNESRIWLNNTGDGNMITLGDAENKKLTPSEIEADRKGKERP